MLFFCWNQPPICCWILVCRYIFLLKAQKVLEIFSKPGITCGKKSSVNVSQQWIFICVLLLNRMCTDFHRHLSDSTVPNEVLPLFKASLFRLGWMQDSVNISRFGKYGSIIGTLVSSKCGWFTPGSKLWPLCSRCEID